MKRMVSFSLALLMFLFVFAGCRSGKKPGPTPVGPQSETDSVLPEKTWEGRELKAIEKDTSVVESAIDADDVSTKISSEVYARNAAIETKYNFTITTNRYSAERSPSESIVWNEAAAGESTYDIVVDASSYMKGCLSDFVFADLRSLPYIKWTAPGWDQSSNDNLTVCGYQFVCTGDLNLREKAGASVIFCNRTMLEQYTTEDLRQTVLDHEWTMEKMKELSALVATKDSGTGEVTRYGLVNSSNNVFLNFMKSTYGMDICTKDENDVPSFTFDNSAYYEKTIGWIDDLLLLYSNPDYTYTQRYSGTKPNAMEDLFKNGKAYFPIYLCFMLSWMIPLLILYYIPFVKCYRHGAPEAAESGVAGETEDQGGEGSTADEAVSGESEDGEPGEAEERETATDTRWEEGHQ